jgi:hypothetical protein
MRSFEERQKGFEAAFMRDQELSFRIAARRNKLFGLWAAGCLGLPAGEPTEAYARTVVAADFEAPGDEDVIAKVQADFAAAGLRINEAEIRAEIANAAVEARRQLSK